jgi:amino acid adenylation domain-containing protein
MAALAQGNVGTNAPPPDRAPALWPAQADMWLAEKMGIAGSGFTNLAGWRIEGPLDVAALDHAVGTVITRNDAFSMRVIARQGKPVPVFDPPVTWDGMTVETAPEHGVDDWLEQRQDALATQVFDIENGPLVRATLLCVSDDLHVFIMAVHHLVSDETTFALIGRQVTALYRAAMEGGNADLAIPVGGYARSLRRAVDTGAPGPECPTLVWPSVLPEGPARPGQVHLVGKTWPLSELPRIKALATALGCSSYAALAAVFQVFLSRYCDTSEVAITVGRSIRLRPEDTDLIGCLVDYIALPATVRPDMTLRDIAQTLGAAVRATPRGVAHASSAQASFTLYDAGGTEPDLPGLTVTKVLPRVRGNSTELNVSLRVRPDSILVQAMGQTSLFSQADVRQVLDLFEDQVMQMLDAADPAALTMADLPLMSPQDRQAVAAFAQSGMAPCADDVPGRIAAMAARHPDLVAIDSPLGALDYKTLLHDARSLARWLHAQGLRPGDVVALAFGRGRDLIRAAVAGLEAGLTLAPLDPDHPRQRLIEMVQTADCTAVLLPPGAPADPDWGVRALILPDLAPTMPGAPAATPTRETDPDRPAYVVFTSGSTGRPKGALTTHRALLRLADGLRPTPPDPGDRLPQIASPGFDGAFIEIWGALLRGATLVTPEGDLGGAAGLARLFKDRAISKAFLTTSLFNLMADSAPDAFAGCNWIAFGGEVASLPHIVRAQAACPGVTFVNAYGPTENGALTTAYVMPDKPGLSLPIGNPLPGNVTVVLDAAGNLLPPGFMGELWIGGAGLSLGYVGDAARTAAAFTTRDPTALGLPPGPPLRLYRTGDRVRADAAGVLTYLGRRDDQLKISGLRVDPSEIERMLTRPPQIRDAALVPIRSDAAPGAGADGSVTALAVVLIAAPGADRPGDGALRKLWRADIARPLIPSRIVWADALPLTPNGKRDRAALRAMIEAGQGGATAATDDRLAKLPAPLLTLWQAACGAPDNGLDSDYFLSGGTSLGAMTLLAGIEAEFGCQIELSAFFDDPRLERLAQLVQDARPQENTYRHLVLLRAGNPDKPPVVAVMGLHGAVAWARGLVANWPEHGPSVYGLNLPPDDPTASRYQTLAELTESLADELIAAFGDAASPSLMGFSFGGFLAAALAATLEQRGQKPARVILIDAASNFLRPSGDEHADEETASNRLGALRNDHHLVQIDAPIDLVICTVVFPLPRPNDTAMWSLIGRSGTRRHEIASSHLVVVHPPWVKVLSRKIDHILGGSAEPVASVAVTGSAADIDLIYAARDAHRDDAFGRAAQLYRKALARNAAQWPFLWSGLMRCLADADRGWALRRVVRHLPKSDVAAWSTAATTLSRSAQPRAARRAMQRVVDLSGGTGLGTLHAILMYWRAGKRAKARNVAASARATGRTPLVAELCDAHLARLSGDRGTCFDLVVRAMGRSDISVAHVIAILDLILRPADHVFALRLIDTAIKQFPGSFLLEDRETRWRNNAAEAAAQDAAGQPGNGDARSGASEST